MKPFMLTFALLMSLALEFARAEYVIIQVPQKERDPFRDKITGQATVQKESGSELFFVPIRGCGKVSLFRNAKGDLPKTGDRIEYAFDGRCKISDWRKL